MLPGPCHQKPSKQQEAATVEEASPARSSMLVQAPSMPSWRSRPFEPVTP